MAGLAMGYKIRRKKKKENKLAELGPAGEPGLAKRGPKPGLKARLTLAISQSLSKPRDKKSGASGTSRPARIGQNRAKGGLKAGVTLAIPL